MAYANPADLCSWMQVPSVDTATATLVLQVVADAMDDYCGQSIAHQDVVGLLLDGTGGPTVVLPGVPVTNVVSVEILGLDGTWTMLAEGADFTWSDSAVLTRVWNLADPQGAIGRSWPSRSQSIRVSYGRGHGAIPSGAKSVNTSAAARIMPNPMGLTAERIGGMDLRFSKDGADFNTMEKRTLDRLSDPVIA